MRRERGRINSATDLQQLANPMRNPLAYAVGYHTLKIYPGMNMFTINLANMDDPDGYTLDQIFPGKDADGNPTPGMISGATGTAADYVKVWNPELNDGAGGYSDTFYLFYRKGNVNSYTWRKSLNEASSLKVKSGMCFWFYHKVDPGTPALTFAVPGQVEYSQQGATLMIKPGMNMIGAPFAADADLNSVEPSVWEGLAGEGKVVAGATGTASDYVKVWDPLANDGAGGYSATYYLFYRKGNANSYTWRISLNAIAPANFIKMGQGAWYYCKGTGFEIKLPIPYSL